MRRLWLAGMVALTTLWLARAVPAGAAGGAGIGGSEEALARQADEMFEAGRYDEATRAARARLALIEARLGPNAPEVGRAILLVLRSAYWGSSPGDPEFLALARRAVAIDERTAGADDARRADSLQALAATLVARGEAAEARGLIERALALREETAGPESPETALAHRGLGLACENLGDLARARAEYERALATQERALGRDHREVATTLNNLASVQRTLGDYPAALESRQRCLAIRERVFGSDHPQVAWALHNLANLYADLGELARARVLYERALAIREKILPRDHPDLGYSHNSLGIVAYGMGDYATARAEYEQALAIREKAYGRVHRLVAATLNNLGNLLDSMGDVDGAAEVLERSLDIKSRTLGPDHVDTAMTANNLGNVLAEKGDLDRAETLTRRALAAREKELGAGHPDVGRNLDDLGWIRHLRGDDAAALPLLRKALETREKALGVDHSDVAETLERLAIVTSRAGDPATAYPLAVRALDIQRRMLGPRHPAVAATLATIAALRLRSGDAAGALDAALESESIGRDHFRVTARHLSQREALQYEETRPSGLDIALAALAAPASGRSDAEARTDTDRVLDGVIRSRALVLDAIATRHREAAEARTQDAARRMESLHDAGRLFARLARRPPDSDHPERYLALLREAREKKERAERDLVAMSGTERAWSHIESLGLTDVKAALPPGGALVSYVLYATRPRSPDDPDPVVAGGRTSAYVAFVTRGSPGGGTTTMVPLASAATIEALVDGWREEASRGAAGPSVAGRRAEGSYRLAGRALRRAVWDPVAPLVEGAAIVFVVPDGALDIVNLATFPQDGDRYLVETGPLVHYLSAERDLIEAARPRRAGAGLLVVGGPDYDAAPSAGSDPSARLPSRARVHQDGGGGKRTTGCDPFEDLHFPPLIAARQEASEVARLWSQGVEEGAAGAREIARLTASGATAGAFLAGAPGKRFIHVATHGFFLEPRCGGTSPAPALTDPMILSGLAFAGANRRGGSPDDGLVTAEEIATLDLSAAEWVVLSGCDTALGVVRGGEGVLGLRRAFEAAGAGTLIMTLWPVRDEDAKEWVRQLYGARFGGVETARAVQVACRRMISERRERGRPTHPAAWGAFVAYGAWR